MHSKIQKTMDLLPHVKFLNYEITFMNSHSSSVFQQLRAFPTSQITIVSLAILGL